MMGLAPLANFVEITVIRTHLISIQVFQTLARLVCQRQFLICFPLFRAFLRSSVIYIFLVNIIVESISIMINIIIDIIRIILLLRSLFYSYLTVVFSLFNVIIILFTS